MTMIRLLVVLGLVAQAGSFEACYSQDSSGDLLLKECLVRAKQDVRIPAQEAGVLWEFKVMEGSQLAEGDLMAVVDDRQARAALEVATISLEAAEKRRDEDIERRFAVASSLVAKNAWEKDLMANAQHEDSVPEIEIQQKKLSFDRALLQIEKADNDGILAGFEAQIKGAELAVARQGVERRSIVAPFGGEVVNLIRQQSEWVSPGDPILRLVQFDTLYVEKFIASIQFNPADILGHPVTVRAMLARGQEVVVAGEIVYVSQMVQADGSYLIRAEVHNKRNNGQWLLRPGALATMTIHLEE